MDLRPPFRIPHRLEYPLGSWMHLGVIHPRLEARGRPFPRSLRSRSRVNPCVLRPLTRGPQGQPSPLRTPHGRPGVQGIFPASRGQAPDGWPMVHHSMATGFPIPRGCCWALSVSLPIPCSPLPLPVSGPIPAFLGFPIPRGCCAARFHPSSRVCTPPGRQQPCGAGPLDPHPSGDCFVRLARVAPFPPPPLSPVPRPSTHLGLFPASHALPVSWGRRVALVTRPCLSCRLFFASRFFLFFNPPGRQQPSGVGPLDSHPSRDWFVCLVLVAPFPPPSACVVCSLQDLWWVLLPGLRAPRYPCISPTRSPFAVVFLLCCFLFVFFSRNPRSLFCPFALPRSPAARSLCASHPPEALWGFVRVFFFHRASCLAVPSSLYARTTTLHRSSVTAHFGALFLSHRPPVAWPLAVAGHARWAPLPRVRLI